MKIFKVSEVKTPQRAHSTDSWIDFFVPEGVSLNIEPKGSITFRLGVKVVIPDWMDLVFHNRSSIASNNWVILWACVVDNGYTWELILNLINTSWREFRINWGDKIVQWVLRRVELNEVEEVDLLWFETEIAKKDKWREEGKLGSTNKK